MFQDRVATEGGLSGFREVGRLVCVSTLFPKLYNMSFVPSPETVVPGPVTAWRDGLWMPLKISAALWVRVLSRMVPFPRPCPQNHHLQADVPPAHDVGLDQDPQAWRQGGGSLGHSHRGLEGSPCQILTGRQWT